MADKDYCPRFNGKRFGAVRSLLLEGDVEGAAQTCASIIVSSSKAALSTHSEMVQHYLAHLQALASCSMDARQESAFPVTALTPDKDAETLRRAGCDLHTQLQYRDGEQISLGEISEDFLVTYFQHQELRQCLAPMEAEAADGHLPTDQNLEKLFQELRERTTELYRDALQPLASGKSLDQVRIKRPKSKRKTDLDLSYVVGNVAGKVGN